jgi:hypothetical protein
MANAQDRKGGNSSGGYKENHGEDSQTNKITKGTYYQVGTVMPMTENAVSVNKKEPGAERGS